MRRLRRGNYATLFALSLTVMLAFMGLFLDASAAGVTAGQLSNGLEAAAHAGVSAFDGTAEGVARGEELALAVAALNRVGGSPLELDAPVDLEFGVWDAEARRFWPSDDPEAIDALRVTHVDTSLRARYAALKGRTRQIVLERGVVAAQRVEAAAAVDCYLPIAIPSCLLESEDEALQGMSLVFNPAGADNVGWGRVGGPPDASWLSEQILDCEQDGRAEVGDLLELDNGMKSSVLQELADTVAAEGEPWDDVVWGERPGQLLRSALPSGAFGLVLEAAMPVFESGPEYCEGGGGFTESAPIVGFAWGGVYDVVTQGAAAEKNVYVRLDLVREHHVGAAPGGELEAGVLFSQPILVQ